MTNDSNVTEGQCGGRRKGIWARLSITDRRLSRIEGGIYALAFFAIAAATAIGYHINHRFTNIETTLDKIEARIPPILIKYP